MATYTALALEDAERLGRVFGVHVVAVRGLAAGSVNSNYELTLASGKKLFARIYEEQGLDGAKNDIALVTHLAAHGIATPRPIPRADGSGYLAEHAGKCVAFFPWIEGTIRCTKSVSPSDARAVGRALAKVHLTGSPRPRESRFSLQKLFERCDAIERADDPRLAAMARMLRRELAAIGQARDTCVPRGLIHGDLFRDNVLWDGDQLAALLDFESASDGVFAFDLAVTLLAWTYDDDFRWDVAKAMVEGYESARRLERGDVSALFREAEFACLRFTTTRITDYAMRAHLAANVPRDWRRFWDRLGRLRALGEPGFLRALGLTR